MWIDSDLHGRQGKAITNFKHTLPSPDSDLAIQMTKDPYNLSFIQLEATFREKELEQGLMAHIQKFLLELGQGFAFVGRQVRLTVNDKQYCMDLLFYHVKLKRYIVVELKAQEFDPKDISQLNFYLSAVDDEFRQADDKPTIGMLFCRTKHNITVEYALRDFNKPIGVAGYEVSLIESLSRELKENLPTVQELEAELEKEPWVLEAK
jgi:predicted nuclease of restriction endonuclease-like (RecB) superfamily